MKHKKINFNHPLFIPLFQIKFHYILLAILRKKDNKREAPIETIGTSVFPISTWHNLGRLSPSGYLGMYVCTVHSGLLGPPLADILTKRKR
ncbi:hypothetical protein NC652_030908 [Populus alba x Populus x berolinensis]|nr:hypothetical protein NC652_030908 [Populus alba x Populus x berolinensis]